MQKKVGTFLGIPYNLNKPTWSDAKKNLWNPDDLRLFPPKIYGWGWSMNFYELLRRIGLVSTKK